MTRRAGQQGREDFARKQRLLPRKVFPADFDSSAIIDAAVQRRDVAQFGSAPALGAGCRRFESCRPDHMRVWFNGRTEAFQASNAGSIPVTRSIKVPGQSLIGSGLFCVCIKMCAKQRAKCGPNRKETSDLAVSGVACRVLPARPRNSL